MRVFCPLPRDAAASARNRTATVRERTVGIPSAFPIGSPLPMFPGDGDSARSRAPAKGAGAAWTPGGRKGLPLGVAVAPQVMMWRGAKGYCCLLFESPSDSEARRVDAIRPRPRRGRGRNAAFRMPRTDASGERAAGGRATAYIQPSPSPVVID